jgi:hypothetical protein
VHLAEARCAGSGEYALAKLEYELTVNEKAFSPIAKAGCRDSANTLANSKYRRPRPRAPNARKMSELQTGRDPGHSSCLSSLYGDEPKLAKAVKIDFDTFLAKRLLPREMIALKCI